MRKVHPLNLPILPELRGKIDFPDVCWEWRGYADANGYGYLNWQRKNRPAHRVVYSMLVGFIPEDMVLDHLCRNHLCVNPRHLEIVTDQTNILRGVGIAAINAKKTHCKRDHPLSGNNLYIYKRGDKLVRLCALCKHLSRSKRKGHTVKQSTIDRFLAPVTELAQAEVTK